MFKKTKKVKAVKLQPKKSRQFLQQLNDENFQMILVESEKHSSIVGNDVKLLKPETGFRPLLTSTPKKCKIRPKADEHISKKTNRLTISEFINELYSCNEVNIEKTISNDSLVNENFIIPDSKCKFYQSIINDVAYNGKKVRRNLEPTLNVTVDNELNESGFDNLLKKLSKDLVMKKPSNVLNETAYNFFEDIFKTPFKEDQCDNIQKFSDTEKFWESVGERIKLKPTRKYNFSQKQEIIQMEETKIDSKLLNCFDDLDEANLESIDWDLFCRLFLKCKE